MSGLTSFLGALKWGRATNLDQDLHEDDYERCPVLDVDGPGELASANVVTSRLIDKEEHHGLLLDLDVPAYLIPSSTEGHSHLYIDVEIHQEQWQCLMECLHSAGVIEEGYMKASLARGFTSLRLPWVKKPEPVAVDAAVVEDDPWQIEWPVIAS